MVEIANNQEASVTNHFPNPGTTLSKAAAVSVAPT